MIRLDLIYNEFEFRKTLKEVKDTLKDKLDMSVEHIEALKKKIKLNESIIQSYTKEKDKYFNLLKIRNQFLVILKTFFDDYESVYKEAVEEFSGINKDILHLLELRPELIFDTDLVIEELLQNCVDHRKIKTKENLEIIWICHSKFNMVITLSGFVICSIV